MQQGLGPRQIPNRRRREKARPPKRTTEYLLGVSQPQEEPKSRDDLEAMEQRTHSAEELAAVLDGDDEMQQTERRQGAKSDTSR